MKYDPKHRLFVRWSCHTLDDERLDVVSILARHVFDRGLLQARRSSSDGLVTIRQVMDGMRDADGLGMAPLWPGGPPVDADQINAALAELTEIGLLSEAELPGRWEITGWTKHNDPQTVGTDSVTDGTDGDRAKQIRDRQIASAHRTNHGLGRHEGKPNPECEECRVATVLDGIDVDTDSVATVLTEQNKTHHHLRDTETRRPLVATEVRDVANAIASALGANNDQAIQALPGAVMRAQANGWTPSAMASLADYAALVADHPKAYWLAAVNRPAPDRELTPDELRDFLEANPADDQENAA